MKKISTHLLIAIITATLFLNIFALSTFNATATDVTKNQWKVRITGLVQNPLTLTLTNLTTMPATSIEANIYCVDFPSQMVTGGMWTGVKLSYLLGEAVVLPSAIKVAFYAADGYSTDLDLQTANRQDVILAYQKDGEPLYETLRLVVPGKWGYKWISQVNSIKLVDNNYLGKWESQGYSDVAEVELGTTYPSRPIAPAQPSVPSQSDSTLPNLPSNQPTESSTTPPVNTQTSNSSSSAPSQDAQNPKPETLSPIAEPIPMTWIISAAASIVIGICVLIYFQKHRH
jgi:DMSO/TMAO reductase YedYZ molybdopterin-dependent catalytic subunit